mmetsp:Transcript_31978/g.83928  ORF Transcript_31978/g.83928 Transcript_31978/m.83928 type:complete len:88 (-) Transcript_31978:585-848(-)
MHASPRSSLARAPWEAEERDFEDRGNLFGRIILELGGAERSHVTSRNSLQTLDDLLHLHVVIARLLHVGGHFRDLRARAGIHRPRHV